MKLIKQANKTRQARKAKENVFGNIKAYVGRCQVFDFGLDEFAAREWVAYGVFSTAGSETGWVSVKMNGSFEVESAPAPKATESEIRAVRLSKNVYV